MMITEAISNDGFIQSYSSCGMNTPYDANVHLILQNDGSTAMSSLMTPPVFLVCPERNIFVVCSSLVTSKTPFFILSLSSSRSLLYAMALSTLPRKFFLLFPAAGRKAGFGAIFLFVLFSDFFEGF